VLITTLAPDLMWTLGLVVVLIYILALATAAEAIMESRSPQGAIAWAISLITFPWISLPLYLVLGRKKFHGYVDARHSGNLQINKIAEDLNQRVAEFEAPLSEERMGFSTTAKLARMPFTGQNKVDILVDGRATFGAIFEGIESAAAYILVQFFIIKDDALGRDLKSRLIRKAREGVRVYVLYDEVGSRGLSNAYIDELEQAGVEIHPFKTTKGRHNRFQLIFRNHRKIVIVDGRSAYLGGLNVGDEYMGLDPHMGKWRDTHARLEGPAVQSVQLSFVEDWYWATKAVPQLDWVPRAAGDQKVLVLPTGPADELETCGLFFVQAINSAKHRIWIASPYFVPDSRVLGALQLAGLRGVDVRIILPEKPDHLLVYLSAFSYLNETERAGVKIYRYQPGFLHQKVMLIDHDIAAIGTANLDNRSFRLNFEITMVCADDSFASQVEKMLEQDLSNCVLAQSSDLENRSFWFKFGVRLARLMDPIQ